MYRAMVLCAVLLLSITSHVHAIETAELNYGSSAFAAGGAADSVAARRLAAVEKAPAAANSAASTTATAATASIAGITSTGAQVATVKQPQQGAAAAAAPKAPVAAAKPAAKAAVPAVPAAVSQAKDTPQPTVAPKAAPQQLSKLNQAAAPAPALQQPAKQPAAVVAPTKQQVQPQPAGAAAPAPAATSADAADVNVQILSSNEPAALPPVHVSHTKGFEGPVQEPGATRTSEYHSGIQYDEPVQQPEEASALYSGPWPFYNDKDYVKLLDNGKTPSPTYPPSPSSPPAPSSYDDSKKYDSTSTEYKYDDEDDEYHYKRKSHHMHHTGKAAKKMYAHGGESYYLSDDDDNSSKDEEYEKYLRLQKYYQPAEADAAEDEDEGVSSFAKPATHYSSKAAKYAAMALKADKKAQNKAAASQQQAKPGLAGFAAAMRKGVSGNKANTLSAPKNPSLKNPSSGAAAQHEEEPASMQYDNSADSYDSYDRYDEQAGPYGKNDTDGMMIITHEQYHKGGPKHKKGYNQQVSINLAGKTQYSDAYSGEEYPDGYYEGGYDGYSYQRGGPHRRGEYGYEFDMDHNYQPPIRKREERNMYNFRSQEKTEISSVGYTTGPGTAALLSPPTNRPVVVSYE